jgi:lysophospholipase
MIVISRHTGRLQAIAPGSGGFDPFVLKQGFLDNLLTGDGTVWGRLVAEAAAWPEQTIGGATYRWLSGALDECRRLAALEALPLPMLVGLGGQDRIISAEAIRQRVASWPGARLLELPESRHEPMMERAAIRDAFLTAMIGHFHAAA